MLPELLPRHSVLFEALANAWLAAGAESFSIWENNQPLQSWVARATDIRSGLVCPVEVENQVIGELRVAMLATPAAQMQLQAQAQLIAHLLPIARDLDEVTLELIETRDQLLSLYHLTEACRTCFSMESVLHILVNEIARMAKVKSAVIVLMPARTPWLIAQEPGEHFDQPSLEYFVQELGEQNYLLHSEGDAQVLLMPIKLNDSLAEGARAFLGLANKQLGGFRSPDIKFAEAMAAQSAAQIENILLVQSQVQFTRLQTEMELARQVQISLMPKELPHVAGLKISAVAHPAMQVGGDFYDFMVKPNQSLFFIVGDLSGKGFSAALLMSMTRTVLRSETHEHSTPEMILSDANHELYDDLNHLNSFATLFIGQYTPEDRSILFANAGHSPVIYIPANGPARLLIADGTPMGILPFMQSRDHCLRLSEGDVLLIGTDGLTDVTNPTEQRFGYEKLLALAESLSKESPQQMADSIFRELALFSASTPPEDDQTLVILQCIGM